MLGRILVVDDNAVVRETYSEVLRHRGYDVMQAGDGEEALKVIDESSIDLAIIDVIMPVMGGLELRQVLQNKAPGIATILVTGQSDKVDGLVDDDPDFQTGRVAMLYKPVHPVMLLAEVDKRLMKAVEMR